MPLSLRLGIRTLRRSPGFTLLALAILTLGIGATTAMFSITRTVLVKPLAYRDPEQLVSIMFRIPSFSKQVSTVPVNAQHYLLWRDHSRTLEQVALLGSSSHILSGIAEPEHVNGALVSANFFELLGVQPVLGRAFLPGEDQRGRDRVVIVSNDFWRHELAGRRDVLGQKILLDGEPYQVVGVMPAAFPFPRGAQLSDVMQLPDRTRYWLPLVFSDDDLRSPIGNMDFTAIARLKSGVTLSQATADLSALEKVIEKRFPERIEFDVVLHPLQQLMSREVRLPLIVLMSAVAAVLLIVCINMMNLMLVRAAAQRREWAVRLAVGAAVRDLVRGALLEGLLLSLTAAGFGSLLAAWLLYLVRFKAPVDLPRIDELSFDPAAFFFALAISAASALLFSIWPAWRSARIDPQDALRSSSRSATQDRQGHYAGKVLVAAEVALGTLLLLTAGLLLRSFVTILGVDPGLRVEHLLTVGINLPPNKYQKDSDVHSFYKRLLEKVNQMPAVEAAGTVSALPLTPAPDRNNNPVTAGDRPVPPVVEWAMSHLHSASSGYFKAAGIPMKQGRPFEERDGKTLEAVISDNLANRLWPHENPIGRPLRLYSGKYMAKIVGVVGNVHASLTEAAGRNVYFPDWEEVDQDMSLVVRTASAPETLASAIRATIHQLEPQAAISTIETMRQVVANSLSAKRFQLILLVSFAAVALLLACLGTYSVLAFATTRRTFEIGIRMALGAVPKEILTAILKNGLAPVLIGMAAGLFASAAVSGLLRNLLFQVRPLDPLIYLATAVTLLSVAALACFVPARRAAKLNPVEALRHE